MHPREWLHPTTHSASNEEEETKATATWREDTRAHQRPFLLPPTRRYPLAGGEPSINDDEPRREPRLRSLVETFGPGRLPSLSFSTVLSANPLGQERRHEYQQHHQTQAQYQHVYDNATRTAAYATDHGRSDLVRSNQHDHYHVPRAEFRQAHAYADFRSTSSPEFRIEQLVSAPRKASLAFILDANETIVSPNRAEASIARMQLSDASVQDEQEDSSDISSDYYEAKRTAADRRTSSPPARATSGRKSAIKKSRICKIDNCTRYVVNKGLCIGHGGGKRCAVAGCTSSAKNMGVCWKHGGSTKCTIEGCDNRAKSRGVCWSHGGGRKCKEENCVKTAVSNGLCWAHGGGKRCIVDDCKKPAYERNGNLCALHKESHAPSA